MKEARAAALLRSPHVAVTNDIGEHEGSLFIVMEYVEGVLISERLRQGPLSLSEATDLAMQVADALEEAHSYGLVYRDIKGANVIVTARGLAKVLDFGLAKFMPGAAQPTDATQLQLTTPGVVLGTVSSCHPSRSWPAMSTTARICSPWVSSCSRCWPAGCRSRANRSPR